MTIQARACALAGGRGHDCLAGGKLGIEQRTTDDEILDGCLLPMVNEGFKIVEEATQRETDLNIATFTATASAQVGGLMHWARHVRKGGLPRVVADIRKYGEPHPNVPYWEPCELLVRRLKAAAKAKL